MSVNRARRATHRTTVLLGDVQAARRGRVVERVANRLAGRLAAMILRGVWR
jgi:hypothetical protein